MNSENQKEEYRRAENDIEIYLVRALRFASKFDRVEANGNIRLANEVVRRMQRLLDEELLFKYQDIKRILSDTISQTERDVNTLLTGGSLQ